MKNKWFTSPQSAGTKKNTPQGVLKKNTPQGGTKKSPSYFLFAVGRISMGHQKIFALFNYLLMICTVLCPSSCENTNVVVLTDAAADAVSAMTLTDEDVRNLALRSAHALDNKFTVAPVGNPYDARLRKLLGAYSERDGNTFNAKVYLTKDVNAFAMADGTIRVYSGLMDLMNDEELLFVIGHEMGHVVKEHSRRKVRLAYATSALRKGLASQNTEVGQIAGSVVGAFAEQLTNAQFSQHEERQADQYGAAFLEAAGHDTSSAVSALHKLSTLSGRHTFLSSHPDPEARARAFVQGGTSEKENQDTILGRLLEYGEMILVGLFGLGRSFINWVLSLL